MQNKHLLRGTSFGIMIGVVFTLTGVYAWNNFVLRAPSEPIDDVRTYEKRGVVESIDYEKKALIVSSPIPISGIAIENKRYRVQVEKTTSIKRGVVLVKDDVVYSQYRLPSSFTNIQVGDRVTLTLTGDKMSKSSAIRAESILHGFPIPEI